VDDETKLVFAPGVILKKTGRYDFVLVNHGALDLTMSGVTPARKLTTQTGKNARVRITGDMSLTPFGAKVR
jgi:hypothetical protein